MGSTSLSTLARSYVKFLQQAKTASNSLGQVRSMSAGHDPDGWKMWKKMFFLVGIPVIVLGHVNAFGMADGSAHIPPPYVPYDHLRIRTKLATKRQKSTKQFSVAGFPWGDGNHSLIHNSHLNALPAGTNMERRSIKQSVDLLFVRL